MAIKSNRHIQYINNLTADALGLNGGTMTGALLLHADPTQALQAATKQYVDNVAQGLDAKASVLTATIAALPANSATAQTLTASANGAFPTLNGVVPVLNMRILVKNEAASQNNGIYVLSTVGDAGAPWQLTRSSDANTWNNLVKAFTFVEQGTNVAGTGWVASIEAGGTLGTTSIPWTQFSGAGTYSAGTGLTLTGTEFSITNTSVAAGSYGSAASKTVSYTVNAQGQLTVAAEADIAISAGQVAVTNAQIIVGNGSNVGASVAMSGDVSITNAGVTTVVSASDTVAGKIELATQAEVLAGTDTVRAVTPATLAGNYSLNNTASTTFDATKYAQAFNGNVAVDVATMVLYRLYSWKATADMTVTFSNGTLEGFDVAGTGTTQQIFAGEVLNFRKVDTSIVWLV